MSVTGLAYGLSALVGVGIVVIGAQFLLAPRAAAAALVALTRAVLPGMLERRRGFVLNTASTIAFQPAPGQATYGASKAFVLSYSEALAEELRGTGVRVAAICPGATDTAFLGAMGAPVAATSAIYRRHGSAAHVADAAVRMLDGRRVVKVPGLMNAVMAQAGRLAPRPVLRRLTGRLLAPCQAGPGNSRGTPVRDHESLAARRTSAATCSAASRCAASRTWL